jgi:hypothetical protein
MALGFLTATTGIGNGFFLVKFFFFSIEFRAINELDCENVSSQLMAMGLFTATADTGNGFFLVKFFFFQLDSELSMSLIVRM